MDKPRLISDYKDDSHFRLSFNRLAGEVFGIDFEGWYQKGFWQDQYICHSFAVGDEIVANVSVSKMDLVLQGSPVRALQIGTVMTKPDHRGQGLSRRLMEEVLDAYEPRVDLIYLFANASVLDFYPRFGFAKVTEASFKTRRHFPKGTGSLRKLDPSKPDDWRIFLRLTKERRPLSGVIDAVRTENLLVWYVLNVFGDNLYYAEDLDAALIVEVGENRLELYDILSPDRHSFEELSARLGDLVEGETEINFLFTPEFPDLTVNPLPFDAGDTLFVKTKGFAWPERSRYPAIAHA